MFVNCWGSYLVLSKGAPNLCSTCNCSAFHEAPAQSAGLIQSEANATFWSIKDMGSLFQHQGYNENIKHSYKCTLKPISTLKIDCRVISLLKWMIVSFQMEKNSINL